MKKDNKKNDLKFDEWLYLIHHIHHYVDKKGKVSHEIHHCFLFSKKNLGGNKFKIKHLVIKNKLYHVLEKKFVGILYDHWGNPYKIINEETESTKYSLVKLNKKTTLVYEKVL